MQRPIQAGLGLFVCAAGAFGLSAYALGAWLALGCISCAAFVLTATFRADRPATVDALHAIEARLAQIEHKATFLTTSFGAAFPARQPQTPMSNGKPVSPVRPPYAR